MKQRASAQDENADEEEVKIEESPRFSNMATPLSAMDQILKVQQAKQNNNNQLLKNQKYQAAKEHHFKARDDNSSIVENANNTAEYSPARYNNHPKQTNFSGSQQNKKDEFVRDRTHPVFTSFGVPPPITSSSIVDM